MTSNPELATEFGWIRFYEEFADKLLAFRDNRDELIDTLHRIASNSYYSIKHLNDEYRDGTTGPLRDICPFSTLALFNRSLSDAIRTDIARELADFLGVKLPPPTAFEGVPLLLGSKFLFFFPEHGQYGREPDDIDSLWDVFSNAIHFTDHGDYGPFVQSYDKAANVKGVSWNLTAGLYWTRPRKFQSLCPVKLRRYIRNDLKIPVDSGITKDAETYLSLLNALKEKFRDPNCQVHSFQELSLAADLNDNQRNLLFPLKPPNGSEKETVSKPEISEPKLALYSVDSILKDGCFLEESHLSEILDRLKTKKNLILQGPPGTGKTWLAKRLAYALIGERDDYRVRSFQFHPNMSYEDFVRGYRPNAEGKLDLVDGPFIEMINEAKAHPHSKYVMVIEEINRGNPAQIFGEMLTLLEADKRTEGEALRLVYPKEKGERVFIPENLYVIGTMNVADRSLALVDFALRRRFAFVNLEPALNERWSEWVSERGIDPDFVLQIKGKLNLLNETIAGDSDLGPQFKVGHSYVTPNEPIPNATEWFRQVVETEIGPLLDEYWNDNHQKSQEERNKLLRNI